MDFTNINQQQPKRVRIQTENEAEGDKDEDRVTQNEFQKFLKGDKGKNRQKFVCNLDLQPYIRTMIGFGRLQDVNCNGINSVEVAKLYVIG